MTILIAGATGTVGRHLVQQLTDQGHAVRALTRNPANVDLPPDIEVVGGDLTRPGTLTTAFEGVIAAHLITFGGDEGEALTTGPQLVELATQAGVRRITVLSGWERSSVEDALEDSDIGWTLLAPVEFMSNALEWAESIRADGVLRLADTAPSAVVHEADIAAVAATALTEDGHAGEEYWVTGPEALTPADRAHLIGEAIGARVVFERLTLDQERERLLTLGHPEEYVEFYLQLVSDPPPQGSVVLPTVERVTGRPARTFAQWALENAAAFQDQ